MAVGSGSGRPAKVWEYLGKDGGGEPPAPELDQIGGGMLADGVYVGQHAASSSRPCPSGHTTRSGVRRRYR